MKIVKKPVAYECKCHVCMCIFQYELEVRDNRGFIITCPNCGVDNVHTDSKPIYEEEGADNGKS